MAIIGSVGDVRQLLGSAELLAAVLEIVQDPKAMKKVVTELEKAEEVVANRKEVEKLSSEVLAIKAENDAKEKALIEKSAKVVKQESANSELKKLLKEQSDLLKEQQAEQDNIKKENEKESIRIANASAALDVRSKEIAEKVADYDALVKERDEYKAKFEAISKTFAKIA